MTEEKKNIELPDITKVQLERDLANKKEEVRRNEVSITEHKEILKLFEDILPLIEKTKDNLYTPESCKVLNPVYAFEENEDYLKLIAAQKNIEHTQLYYTVKDKNIDGLRKTVEAKQKAVDDLKDKIAKMESD
jgi:hypothetical protein